MKITGTFLDEISHDIPHQNWGLKEWEKDFQSMKAIGIDTVILIRCGHKRWMTYPSQVLQHTEGCYLPPVDLVEMFLQLSEKYGFGFYFGGYDSGKYWSNGKFEQEVDINLAVFDEVWARYGKSPAFKGWYLTQEVGCKIGGIVSTYAKMGRHCKAISGNLPVIISPYVKGVKAVSVFSSQNKVAEGISISDHEKDWDEIMCGIKGAVDIIAFQDGHVEFDELIDFLKINKTLAQKYGMSSWTNSETFDRDMPIKFLPIKWEKLLLKLKAAELAGIEKAITFEFSHFMSPNSAYRQAEGLYNRYKDYFNL